ncbi:hypothetical protein AVEN_102068-1 [Araneus ventricosus]|uniref:Uncharacterized protein n=1 Tax=Araneus ventricosus TaxID=182803 RepID=A0A4Y2MWF3_ARAVE|nr:hypothetical protein AVEN_102068-1 [Araneus ventricosus]
MLLESQVNRKNLTRFTYPETPPLAFEEKVFRPHLLCAGSNANVVIGYNSRALLVDVLWTWFISRLNPADQWYFSDGVNLKPSCDQNGKICDHLMTP